MVSTTQNSYKPTINRQIWIRIPKNSGINSLKLAKLIGQYVMEM